MNNSVVKAAFIAFIGATIIACSGTYSATEESQSMQGGTETDMNKTSEMVLDTSSVKPFYVDAYYSPLAHGPAQKFYTFADQAVILRLVVPNKSRDFTLEGGLYIFPEGTSEEALAKWVNNKHSDALYGDAPRPIKTIAVTEFAEIIGAKSLGVSNAHDRHSWEGFDVGVDVRAMTTERAQLMPYQETIRVYVLLD
ncbi:MAG: hypothetical protein ACWA5L_03695 [bacterium]